MQGNTFGRSFCVTTFGESHGPAAGCVIDGCPPGHPLDLVSVQASLPRRKPGPSKVTRDAVDAHPTRCPHPETASAMETAILGAKRRGDSLGGYVRLYVTGVPPGLGTPVFDKLDAVLAQAFMSLPACKGVEIGSGFAGPDATGLEHNDVFEWQGSGVPEMATRTNRSGGIQGGITNGMPLDVRLVFKTTA